MPLSLFQYFQAIPDLEDRATYRLGTCPACHHHGMTLKRLVWANGFTELEPFCPNGCSRFVIEQACNQETANAAPLGID